MRVLLNATSEEVNRLGGDFTLYRDWLKLNEYGLDFAPVPGDRVRRAGVLARKVVEKSARTWQPGSIRRRLFLLSRHLYIPAAAVKGAEVIFSHLLFPWVPSGSMPVVWSSQGISPSQYYDRYNKGQWTVEDVAFVYRILGLRADALVISTEACARNVVNWCPELAKKVHVVPAPIFVDEHSNLSKPSREDGIIRLLFVGIDAIRKGLPAVVEAFRVLKSKHSGLQLDIVSRPPADLQEKIKALSGARLYLSSSSVNVKALMAQADIFVLPTHADTYALAVVEAMGYGCAVIISDLEPLPEVAPDKEVGFVVPSGDVGALVERLEGLVTVPDVLRTLQVNAWRRYCAFHAPPVVAKKLGQVLEQAVSHYNGANAE